MIERTDACRRLSVRHEPFLTSYLPCLKTIDQEMFLTILYILEYSIV